MAGVVANRVVRSKWRNPQDCEDIVQDILLSLHSVRHTYDPARPFLPWLLTIGNRRIADQARLLRRRATHETTGEPFPETFSDAAAKTDQDASDDREQIRKALAELSPAHREGIEIVKLRGLSFEVASQATGKSVGALKVTVHRAMKALRQAMERKM